MYVNIKKISEFGAERILYMYAGVTCTVGSFLKGFPFRPKGRKYTYMYDTREVFPGVPLFLSASEKKLGRLGTRLLLYRRVP